MALNRDCQTLFLHEKFHGDLPKDKARARNSDGSIDRKPLKSKYSIEEKNHRIVPLINKEHYNKLVELYQEQDKKLKQRTYGNSPKNYVLFENMTHTQAVTELRKAYSKTRFNPKTYHDCRHTRSTELVGETRDFVLAQYWLGHARQETTLRYTHIYQQSVRKARKKKQKIDFIDYSKVISLSSLK